MRTELITINYRLTFVAAFHCGTGLRGGLVHRLVARTADDFLYLPGSTFKGVLRDRCEQIARLFDLPAQPPHAETLAEMRAGQADIVAQIFGSRLFPGRLSFDDAHMIEPDRALFETGAGSRRAEFRAWQTERRTQVSLSRATNTARSGLLYTSEYGVRDLHFEGCIAGVLEGAPLMDAAAGTFSLMLLVAGLLSLDRIGGNKSSGAGKFTCEIKELAVAGEPVTVESLLEELPYFELYEDWCEEVAG